MRYRLLAIVGLVVFLLSIGIAPAASAEDRCLASLVPADASTYSEIDIDRMLGRAPESAQWGEVLSQMQSFRLIRNLYMNDEEFGEVWGEILQVFQDSTKALGPRIGVAVWLPDIMGILQGALGSSDSGSAMTPQVLVVSDIRDRALFDTVASRLFEELGESVYTERRSDGTEVFSFDEGKGELIRGENWVALSFPADKAHEAAKRALGHDESVSSLWENEEYQDVISALPEDAGIKHYFSAAAMQFIFSTMGSLTESPALSQNADPRACGMAYGVRVEKKNQRNMVIFYSAIEGPHVLDALIGLEATAVYPVFQRARESARKAVCLSNMKNLSLAVYMFEADHDYCFPDASRWVEELTPYMKNETVLICPNDKSGARSSYAMNAALSGKCYTDLLDPANTVVFFETAFPGQNPTGGVEDIAIPGRHFGGNCYALADGSAAWSEEIPNFDIE